MASSSSQAQKRVRLEDTHAQRDCAAEQDQPDAPPQPPPPPPPPLQPHQLLSFALGTLERDRLAHMVNAPLHASQTIDWPLMGKLGVCDRLEAAAGGPEGAVRRAHLGDL
ncbi:hypothetical protein L1987_58031 [Smallanthus sonchifolius]|uniref:Uncharacterized protein n=1 Tax=Smallanthus sonchifolius TaxID=185202 RepID=A0ACB9DEY9_9ASTR|nr:hypothetical protein L1987_58031 [Smallanthus sonchifolius]